MLPPICEHNEQLTQIRTTNLDTVYRAFDRLERRWVALKRITAPLEGLEFASRPIGDVSEPVLRLALMRELQRLSGLRHAYLVPVLDFGVDEEGVPFFTGDLLDNAQPILEAAQTASFGDKLAMLATMLDGLTYLHRHRTMHRGIRPETVLVSHTRAMLTDAGLTILLDPGASGERATLTNTIAYLAPEILRGASHTDASDLYAVGLLAYQMFVGRHPLPLVQEALAQSGAVAGYETARKEQLHANVQQVITAVLYGAPDIQLLIDTLKGGQATEQRWRLIDVIRRLLAKSPGDRISSAEARAMLMPSSTDSMGISGIGVYIPVWVEREKEVSRLADALKAMAVDRTGSVWLLSGKGGAGKTVLLDDLEARARAIGLYPARGRASHQGERPFHALRALLPTLLVNANPLPEAVYSTFKPLVPGLEALIGQPIPDPLPVSIRQAETRITAAVEALFRALKGPTMILMEEMQWDDDGLALIHRLRKVLKSLPILLVMTWREIEVERGKRKTVARAPTLSGITSMQLENLSAAVFPEGFDPEIASRLGRIPDTAWGLLYAAAAAGRLIDRRLLEWINPMLPVASICEWCAEAGLIRIENQRWAFLHERVREMVLARLAPAQLQDLHRQIAQAITALYGDSMEQVSSLAYHWGQAGELGPEALYSAIAGLYAYGMGARALARRCLTRAQEIAVAGQLDERLHEQVNRIMAELVAEDA
ncbi:MAG: protein kinase [Anaerolineae bacterium]